MTEVRVTMASPLHPKAGKDELSPLVTSHQSLLGLFFTLLPALLGTMLEFYEYSVFISVTSEVTHNFFDFDNNHEVDNTETEYGVWLIFLIGQGCRPLGALLFGIAADR